LALGGRTGRRCWSTLRLPSGRGWRRHRDKNEASAARIRESATPHDDQLELTGDVIEAPEQVTARFYPVGDRLA
jgi:hypothetical protein